MPPETIDEWVARSRLTFNRLQRILTRIRYARERGLGGHLSFEDIQELNQAERAVEHLVLEEREWWETEEIPARDEEFRKKFARYLINGDDL